MSKSHDKWQYFDLSPFSIGSKRITAHAHLKRGRISREIQKSIYSSRSMAFSAEKRYHAILRYAENPSIPFSRRFARVTLTHVTGSVVRHPALAGGDVKVCIKDTDWYSRMCNG